MFLLARRPRRGSGNRFKKTCKREMYLMKIGNHCYMPTVGDVRLADLSFAALFLNNNIVI